MTDTNKCYDLIVVGGGLSGVAAAVSAARENLKVLLLERSGCLGGAIANNLVYPFMRFWELNGENEPPILLSDGIFTEIRSIADSFEKSNNLSEFKPEAIKRALDKMVVDAKVDVLFHAAVFGAETKADKVVSVDALTRSGVATFKGKFFIDASGNGDLLEYAGCDYQKGRESDGLCQPMTTCFRMCGVDVKKLIEDAPAIQEKYKRLREEGKIKNPRENILIDYGLGDGVVHFNTTRVLGLDPTNAFDLSKAEMIGREQVYEMVAFLKESSPAFKKANVVSMANEIGIRESRKLKGLHVLTADELKNTVHFDDTVAMGNYYIDIHSPTGTGTTIYRFKKGEKWSIPYRSLVPKEYVNLLVAGRCLSATHEAHAAVRIMPVCACLGQAAGIAVAVAYHSKTDTHTADFNKIREKLIKSGAKI